MAQNSQNNQGNNSNRGFAGMDQDKQREIASQGGKASHEKDTGYESSSGENRDAGRKGGENRNENR